MAQPDKSSKDQAAPTNPVQGAGCLFRLYWMVLGYLIAVLCGVSIINHHGDFSFVDIIYWLALGGVLVARWYDIQKFGGTRADGQPASMRDWTVQAVLTGVGGVVAWILIHFVRIQGLW